MVEKRYAWPEGATLLEHSKRKHKVLREYFFQYLITRCQLPQRERFRLAIVDGFAGGGRYECGSPGSPIIFLEELKHAIETININRAAQNLSAIEISCLLILNDADKDVIELLRSNVAPVHAAIKEATPKLDIHIEYLNDAFSTAYVRTRAVLLENRYRNVIFNLDQCGHSHVERESLIDMMRSFPSAEIFYTFMISSLVSFLQKNNLPLLKKQLGYLGLRDSEYDALDGVMNNTQWLGAAEQMVFESLKVVAPFTSPFSINNPNGWRYWLIHFANSYRARQVYNNILHDNSSSQAHFGRSGLNMLSYDPTHESGSLYLFDVSGRREAKRQLLDDVPRLISESGDVIHVGAFYESIYNSTPAHMDDIHDAIIENPDIEVVTPGGGERRKANTIRSGDVLKLKRQRSFPMFLSSPKKDK